MSFKSSYRQNNKTNHLLITLLSSSLVLSACGSGGSDDSDGSNEDKNAPVISLNGESTVSLAYNQTYTDAGATASDDVDGSVSVTTTGSVDSSTIGSYTITYSAIDAAGNEATATRTVNVVDVTAPTITVIDGNAEIFIGDTYTDAGATATDDVDSSITVSSTDDIDESMAGSYTVTYTATDTAGNEATATRIVTVVVPTLSGTAAAGAAIVGTVTVKDSLGATKSEVIEADGSYNVDVTGMTPPFRLRAEGTVGGKVYKLHSYAEAANSEGAVNITPFTDLIIANTAKELAESFFEADTLIPLESDELAAQEDALQAKLQDVFTALGLDTAINLLNTSFSADHSGLDAALDVIQIETDTESNIATITNLIDNSSIEDNFTADEDPSIKIEVADSGALTATVNETIAIANLFEMFGASFADGLPTAANLESFLAANFLHEDQSRAQFLTDITTDPSLIGLKFSSVSVRNLDTDAGTAIVDFNVTFNGMTELEPETWQVAKNGDLGWQLLGNQLIVEADTLTFHCNDYDGTDTNTGGCGLNASFYDNDFTNNGTVNDAPIASATMEIIDANDGTVKDTVYFGNSMYNGAGELSVYNQTLQDYTSDYVNFGSTDGEVNPSIFEVGDIIRYKLYTEALDISVPNQPNIPSDQALVSFDRTLLFLPKTSGLYPVLTTESINAINNFDPNTDLTLSWTVQASTVIDSIRIEVYDNQGNYYDIEDEAISHDATSTELETTSLIESITNDVDFDETNYTLLVRIYAIEPATGQFYSTDYRKQIGGETGGGTAELSCATESGWDETWNNGEGKPTDFYSINDFNTVIADCASSQTLPDFSVNDLANLSWYIDDEVITFDETGTNGVITAYGDDGILGTADDETFYVVANDYAANVIQFSFSETEGGAIVGRDLVRVISESTMANTTVYKARILWEYYSWEESDQNNQDTTHQGAEIYHETYATDSSYFNQPDTSNLTCSTESDWDDINDKPLTFYSIDDFNTVIADCANQMTSPGISKADLENVTWYVYDARLVFDANSDLVLTTYGDDEILGTADDEQYFATVSDIGTNVIELAYSETKGGTILGKEQLYIKSESTYGGKTVFTSVILFEDYSWAESDGDDSDSTHKGAEIYSENYSPDASFDFDSFTGP
ncbi:DUF5011 domain-containing protein [Catenovulum sp. 2E275]|uniref:DUF5011 domain-containing protein n=1 Tax=Catenovulum sp. 2E275 TaxID=2980497 RepID=UPI0021CEE7FD|nr:DUF5011 domain-containing protein [Catenovulum sp. 2E275]MCU4676923.1 DUF5011 domain-containing protein [Catenovulum sp. 2E275]